MRDVMKELGAAAPDPGPTNYKTTHRVITSFIDPSATLGEGSIAWHYSIILADVRIGDRVNIGAKAEIGRGTVIGDDSRVSSGVFLPANSRVGQRVFIGPNATFTDDKHPVAGNIGYTALPPVIEDDASIGAGAVILPGVRIGHHALIGAGAIVTRDVEPYAHVRGEPARLRLLTRTA